MKPTQRISKPVLAFGLAGLAIVGLLIWFALSRQKPAPQETAAPAESESVSPAPAAVAETAPVAPVPAAPSGGLPPVVPISLASLLVPPENDQWSKGVFLSMPRGTQDFGGIEFWIDGMIELQSKASADEKRNYRSRIIVPLAQTNFVQSRREIVERGSNVAAVHLVGATRYPSEGESSVAEIVWRYKDNTTRRTPIKFENHVRDWIRNPYESPAYLPYAFSKVAWRAPWTNQIGRMVRLYRLSYANPEPAKIVRQLEFVSTMAEPSLFLVGVTLDPLKPGERPDDTPNLEPTDPMPASQVEISVQTSAGQPVPNAKIAFRVQQISGKPPRYFDHSLKTDGSGNARVTFPPPQDVERLDVTATHEDYGGRKISWTPSAGDVVPASYVLKLGGGVSIGGIVVDSSDNAIPDAKITLGRYWTGNDEINKKGDQPDFSSRNLTTDAQGRWQSKGVPAEVLNRIHLRVSHPEFVEASLTLGSNPAEETKLRDGTHKTTLQRGLIAQGKVTDDRDNAIAGATVWAGTKFSSERQQTETDAQGSFKFRNVKTGDVVFSVMAKGRAPDSKKVNVKPDMEEIIFRLAAGSVIRVHVQNENGEALAGTRVSLEGRPGELSYDAYEFSANTDSVGNFEWNGAPKEAMPFYFYKEGYEQKRGQRLQPDQDNTVTLRRARQVQGWVLDAATEKPVTKFRVGVGRSYGADQFYADSPGMKEYANANGTFTMDVREEQDTGIKAEADDYAEQVQQLPAAQNGVVQVVFRLKASVALRGVLVAPDGTPVAGGTVTFTSGKSGPSNAYLRNGRFDSSSFRGKVATTDSSGQFTLPSPPESGLVVAAAEMGFGSAPIQQVRDSGRLVLQPFGGIQGTFKIAGQPVAGQEFLFTMSSSIGISTDFQTHKATTDSDGHFTIEKVPSGEGQIVRLVKTTAGSWMHSYSTDVTVQPGQMTQVTLGDSGAVLKGSVRFETPPATEEKLTISGYLFTPMPERPKFQNDDEARAFYESAEWKALTKQRKSYAVGVNEDGTFTMDSIPSGTYKLNLTAIKGGTFKPYNPPVAQGQTTVTIPDSASPYTPIHLGEIILKPAQPPAKPQ